MIVDMGLDNIVYNDGAPLRSKIFNAWIEDWESDILRTWGQNNDQSFLHKFKIMRFIDVQENQTYMIAPENLEFKGLIRSNNQYFVVMKPLYWRDGDNLDLLISREINDDLIVLIKWVEQDPDMGAKIVHPSIDDNSEATDSDK